MSLFDDFRRSDLSRVEQAQCADLVASIDAALRDVTARGLPLGIAFSAAFGTGLACALSCGLSAEEVGEAARRLCAGLVSLRKAAKA